MQDQIFECEIGFVVLVVISFIVFLLNDLVSELSEMYINIVNKSFRSVPFSNAAFTWKSKKLLMKIKVAFCLF